MFSNSAQVSSKLKIITRHKKKIFIQHPRKGPYKTYKSLPLYELGTDEPLKQKRSLQSQSGLIFHLLFNNPNPTRTL